MMVPEYDHDRIVRINTQDHAAGTGRMRWLSAGEAGRMELLRENLLEAVGREAAFEFNGTKPVYRRLSPGCALCGRGNWSCLFINNICNARCFFCPTRQDTQDDPGTSTLTFSDPEEYADYLERFGFEGASISGGEPLMTLEKTLQFVSTLRRRFGEGMYLWMYTNGTLLTTDSVRRLADAGLDEIRFNIVATGYDLTSLRMAIGVIPSVTVEIPAVPEDMEIVKAKLEELSEAGVAYLNLHQIRCTTHNRDNLAGRGYTFLHGPQVGILESELAALRIMDHARENHIDLGINYCSLIYRHRFQTRAARQRWARHMVKPFEAVTHAGLIRTLHIDTDARTIAEMEKGLALKGVDPARWSVNSNRSRMTIDAQLLGMVDDPPPPVKVSYSLAMIRPAVSYQNAFKEVRLASGRTVVLERGPVFPEMELGSDELALFVESFLSGSMPDMDALYTRAAALGVSEPTRTTWQRIIQAEGLRSGLLEYY